MITNLYHNIKNKSSYSLVYKTYILNDPITIIVDRNLMYFILQNSPKLFGPGKYKYNFFSNFMVDNLGISIGQLWNMRRNYNEKVLETNKQITNLHNSISNVLKYHYTKFPLHNFLGENYVKIFDIFNDTNNMNNISNPKVKSEINNKWFVDYINKNHNKNCLLSYAKYYIDDNNEINLYDQLPHWLFPMNNVLSASLIRTIYLITTNSDIYKKLQNNLNSMDINSSTKQILSNKYLQNIIWEGLRINNPVQTLLRKSLTDVTLKRSGKIK
jgi:hypothetical protein